MSTNNQLATVPMPTGIKPSIEYVGPPRPNFSEIEKIGRVMAASGFFTDSNDAAKAIVKIMAGAEMGFSPFEAMTNIHIIKGKPSIGANLMAAAVKASGKYDYRVVQLDEKICDLVFFEGGQEVGHSVFTIEQARAAGTQNLDKFPRNMLFARAISNGVRFYCPDVFKCAIYTPEELGAQVDGEGNVVGQSTVTAEGEIVESAPFQAGGFDEHGKVWCHCGEEARYVRGKSGNGWTCHSNPVVCDFRMKDTRPVESASEPEAAVEPEPEPASKPVRPEAPRGATPSNASKPAEDPHPLDDVAVQSDAEMPRNPLVEEVHKKVEAATKPKSLQAGYFAALTEKGLDTSEEARPRRQAAEDEFLKANGQSRTPDGKFPKHLYPALADQVRSGLFTY